MNCRFCGEFLGKEEQDDCLQHDLCLRESECKPTYSDYVGKNSTGVSEISSNSNIKFNERTGVRKKQRDRAELSHKCKLCDKSFASKYALTRHMISHARAKPFKCRMCESSFTRRDRLQSHETKVHSLVCSMYECLYCTCSFSNKRSFYQHMARHSRRGKGASRARFIAGRRSTVKKGQEGLSMIKRLPHGRSGCCVWCEKTFNCEKNLKVHIALAHKRFQCNICKIRLTSLGGLKKHSAIHTGESFPCDLCGTCYSRKDTLARHMKKVHCDRLHCYKCEYCGKAFSCKESLEYHLKVCYSPSKHHLLDSDGRPRTARKSCKFCRTTFTSNEKLYGHMTSHLSDVEGDQQELALKLKLMLENRVYRCNECGEHFSTRISLCVHHRAHAGYALFKCEYCRSTFDDFKSLRKHLSTHSEESRCQCEFCGHALSKRHLLRHLKGIHCRMPVCYHCCKVYTNQKLLNRHIKYMHSVSRREKIVKLKIVKLRDFAIKITPVVI